MAESRSVVIAALIANGAIAVLKFLGFLLTGSAAMLSETYHSISDTGNQIFLLLGIRWHNDGCWSVMYCIIMLSQREYQERGKVR